MRGGDERGGGLFVSLRRGPPSRISVIGRGYAIGSDTMEVSTKVQVDTIADVGSIGESGARAGRRGCSSSSLERCREASDCSGELPARGFCVGCGAAQRRERQPGVHLAASVSRAGWRGRWLGAGGCGAGRGTAALGGCRHERCSGGGTDGDRAGRWLAGDRRPGGGRFGALRFLGAGGAMIPCVDAPVDAAGEVLVAPVLGCWRGDDFGRPRRSNGLVHAVRCCRVSGLSIAAVYRPQGLYGDTRIGSISVPRA